VASTEEAFKDIVNYVDKNYRTLANKKHRAIVYTFIFGDRYCLAWVQVFPLSDM
jgi:hypothetical protein